jgi:hypothetical protein
MKRRRINDAMGIARRAQSRQADNMGQLSLSLMKERQLVHLLGGELLAAWTIWRRPCPTFTH